MAKFMSIDEFKTSMNQSTNEEPKDKLNDYVNIGLNIEKKV